MELKLRRRTAVLLVNLGTPDSSQRSDVKKYLRQFLMDPRVIDIPAFWRFILVNGIIIPSRSGSSSRAYRQLWQAEGSPLKIYGFQNRDALQQLLPEQYTVFLAMRYQQPSISEVLDVINGQGFDELLVLPLFPQYACASSGSAIEAVLKEVRQWAIIPHVRVISQFYNHPLFIETIAQQAGRLMKNAVYDYFLFSYHGLPERHIKQGSVEDYCQLDDCCSQSNSRNRWCYRAQCFATTRLLVKRLGLKEGVYSTVFQSRLGKDPWIKPYIDQSLDELCKKGINKVLVFSPAFVADCLETTIEIAHEYREKFVQAGGQQLDLVESCNSHPVWVECLKSLVMDDKRADGIIEDGR